jgi:hypothetical protein
VLGAVKKRFEIEKDKSDGGEAEPVVLWSRIM